MAGILTALARFAEVSGKLTPTAYAAAGIGTAAAGPLVQATYGPLTRWADNASNYRNRNLFLPAESLIRLYHSGLMGPAALQEQLGYHGIWWKTTPPMQGENAGRLMSWQRFIEGTRPTWGAAQYLKWLRQGRIQVNDWESALKRMGIGLFDERNLMRNDYENLSLATLVTLRQYGFLTDADYQALAAMIGYRQQEAMSSLSAAASRPGFGDAVELRRLGIIDDSRLAYYLSSAGFTEPDVQLDMQRMQFAPPGTAEIVRSASTMAWDLATSQRWAKDNEVPPQFVEWARRAGLDYSSGTGPFGEPDLASPKWLDVLWRNHWRLFSFGEMASILQRVRGDPSDPNTWSIPGLPPLTQQQVTDVMQSLDVAPACRPYLLEMMYSPVSVRHLRLVMTHNPQPLAWVVGKYQDMGYKPADAALVGAALVEDVRLQAEKPLARAIANALKKLETSVLSAYADGALTRVAAASVLAQQGMDGGVINTLLNAEDVTVNAGIVRKVVARARQDWFMGRTNLQGATGRLLSAGMDPNRVNQIVASWQAERGEGRIVLATGKILSLLRKGFITADEATIRLDNLGWNKPDELLLLAEVQAEIDADTAKAAAAADAANKRAIAEMERLLAKNQARADRIRREMERQTPVNRILQWVRDGIQSATWATNRLTLMGYEPGSIQSMLAEDALQVREGKDAKDVIHSRSLELQRRLFPPSRVAKYVIDGIWTRQQAEAKLRQMDYTAESIKAMMDDAELHRKKS